MIWVGHPHISQDFWTKANQRWKNYGELELPCDNLESLIYGLWSLYSSHINYYQISLTVTIKFQKFIQKNSLGPILLIQPLPIKEYYERKLRLETETCSALQFYKNRQKVLVAAPSYCQSGSYLSHRLSGLEESHCDWSPGSRYMITITKPWWKTVWSEIPLFLQ